MPSGQHRCSVQADGWFHRGKLTPPQFIRAGVFVCHHIHREGNGGPFLFPCTAGSTAATCVHRIGHMTHSTQLTIPAVHAHIKATESVMLMLSFSNGSRTILPYTHTHALDSSGCRHSEHTTHPPAQPPHPHHQIHLQHSQQPPHTNGRRQQSPHAAASMRCKRSIQIHCNVHLVCVCLQKHKAKKKAEYVERRKKLKCTAEVRGRKQQQEDRSNS
ncbi:hypothetical protein TcCL_NonESM08916 [Trypanosoma cruzi]|nr:hypothetical protein TcCL_NonESM08916 [Trypanosoma cruzi]